jgi:tetratricopeptide repeat protein
MSAHHDEQQDIETAKHLWRSGGKWVFAALVAAAIGYFGYVIYQHQLGKRAEAAAALAAGVAEDEGSFKTLQQEYPDSMGAAEAAFQVAAKQFDAGKYDEAAATYQWLQANNPQPAVQAAAVQNLAKVRLQQQKYDDALKALAIPVDEAYRGLIEETRGDIYSAQGKTKEAAAAYKAALEKLPEDSPARDLLEMKTAD